MSDLFTIISVSALSDDRFAAYTASFSWSALVALTEVSPNPE